MKRKQVAILLFADIEVLDFAGPFEVFSVTDELGEYQIFKVVTVAETKDAVRTRNGLSVNPDYAVSDCPVPDILIVPGGNGTRSILKNEKLLDWVRQSAAGADFVLSVCSGALILAKAGLLEGLSATTHHEVLDELESLAPNTKILRNQRYVDNGKLMTSAGISAGIDMSLHVVEKLLGRECAVKTAEYMEYPF